MEPKSFAVRRFVSRFWPAVVVTGVVLGAGGLSAFFAAQATHWAVMSDELQTSKLATSIAQSLSLAPHIHGEPYGAFSQQLYPLVLSPWFGLLGVPQAVHAAHIVNAFLLASAAWPAYLLARDVTGSRLAGCVTATLTAFVPWLVLSTTVLTENVAYPVFVWAVFLCHRAMVRASFWYDVAALAGLLLVFLARTQLFVVAVVFPLALLGHELGRADGDREKSRLRALGDAARRAVSSHQLLAVAYALGIVVVVALSVAGRLGGLFGNYVGTLHGGLLPSGIWRAAAAHLDFVVVAVGIAPLLLAASWAVATIVSPRRREAHAFAFLLILLVPLLTFEVASFDLRFTPGAFIQDRYLFYLAPLLAVGASAALSEREGRRTRAALVLVAGGLFALLASAASFVGGTVIFWASPAAAFHPALAAVSGWVGLTPDSLVRWAGIVIAGVLAILLLRAPPTAGLLVLGATVGALGAFEAVYVSDRYAVPATTVPRPIPTVPPDWIDAAGSDGEPVTLVPNPYLGPDFWWDAEFWNKSVRHVLRVAGGPTFTPFPADKLSIDPRTGRVRSGLPSNLLVLASVETRFHLAGTRTVYATPALFLTQVVERPYRADWVTAGADPDGWVRPGRSVRLRFFPGHSRGRVEVTLTVTPPPGLARPLRFMVESGSTVRSARVIPETPRRVSVPVCIPARRPGEARLIARAGSLIEDGRTVSLHLDRIETRPTGRRC